MSWPSKAESDARRLIDHFSFGAMWVRLAGAAPLPITERTAADAAEAMRAGAAWEKTNVKQR